MPYPGGCDIGGRPIDIHISALQSLGAKIREEDGFIVCDSSIKGGRAVLPFPSVGATENAVLSAAVADGESVIVNAAKEPEIVDLVAFLNKIGAKILGAGTSVIRIEGVKRLGGGSFRPSPDRIEAGTYLIAAAITGGEIELNGVNAENISALLGKLCDNTCKFKIKNDIIYLRSGKRRSIFRQGRIRCFRQTFKRRCQRLRRCLSESRKYPTKCLKTVSITSLNCKGWAQKYRLAATRRRLTGF